jgi:uncharacterized OB-fold protein
MVENMFIECHRCNKCGNTTLAEKKVCPKCGGVEVAVTECEGKGRIVDSTLVYFPPEEYKDLAPYTSVLVQLENGCRLFAIVKGEHRTIDPGSPVKLVDRDEVRGAMFFELEETTTDLVGGNLFRRGEVK